MKVWFVRANGSSLHGQRGHPLYMPEEKLGSVFDLTSTCLRNGFARIGWPATGDLNDDNWLKRGIEAYGSEVLNKIHQRYLSQFRRIETADVITMPGFRGKHVYVGRVVKRLPEDRDQVSYERRVRAYYWHHDPTNEDWFEAAHRVDVLWAIDRQGKFLQFPVSGISGLWQKAFGEVVKGAGDAKKCAREAGLYQI